MSKYTQNIARKKFANRTFGSRADHLIAKPATQTVEQMQEAFYSAPKKTYKTLEGNTVTSEDAAIDADRAAVRAGRITREAWNARWPKSKFDDSKTGLFGGIKNVLGDAVKLAVAPVTLATGGNVVLKTGVGQVVGDASKIAISPVSSAVSSIKGADVDLKLQTNAGKAVNAVVETGSKSLHGLLKGFADTVTGGLATKAVNVIRSDDNKEKAFQYTEMNPTKDKTGIKFVDKVTQVLPAASTALGAAAASVVGGSKIADILGTKQNTGNMKDTETQVGENVLQYQLPLPDQQPLQASFKFEPWHILAVVVAIVLLYVVSKKMK